MKYSAVIGNLCSSFFFQEHNPGIKWDLPVFTYKFVSFWSSSSPLALAEATYIQCRLLAFEYAGNYTGTKRQSSSVSIVTRLWPQLWFPVGKGIFSSCSEHTCQFCSSPSLLFRDYHCLVQHAHFECGVGVTTVPHLVPRFRVSEAKSLLPHVSSWPAQEQLTLLLAQAGYVLI